MGKIPITPQGYKRLQGELRRLKEVERVQNIREIEEARAHGDLSENAEFHAAKERQGFILQAIREIERTLAEAEVIDPTQLNHKRIVFGATVKLLDTETEEEISYQIVGRTESDVRQGKISVESPIARALIGKAIGVAVTVQTPRGVREFEILEISYE